MSNIGIYTKKSDGTITEVIKPKVDERISTIDNTLTTKADDSKVVHNTGNESITGTKTFTGTVNATYLKVGNKDVATAESVTKAIAATTGADTAVFNTLKTTNTSKTATGFKIANDTDLADIFTQNGITEASITTSGTGTYVSDVAVSVDDGKLSITKTLNTPPDTNTHCTYCTIKGVGGNWSAQGGGNITRYCGLGLSNNIIYLYYIESNCDCNCGGNSN